MLKGYIGQKPRTTFFVPCPRTETTVPANEVHEELSTKIQYKAFKNPKIALGFWKTLLSKSKKKSVQAKEQETIKNIMCEPLIDNQESFESNIDCMEDFRKWKEARSIKQSLALEETVGNLPNYEEVAQEELIDISEQVSITASTIPTIQPSISSLLTPVEKIMTLKKTSTTSQADYLAKSILKDYDPHNPENAERVLFANSYLEWISKLCDDITLNVDLEDSCYDIERTDEVSTKQENPSGQNMDDFICLDFYKKL